MTAVVGRDRELAEIASFLDLADEAPRILLLEGAAGRAVAPTATGTRRRAPVTQ